MRYEGSVCKFTIEDTENTETPLRGTKQSHRELSAHSVLSVLATLSSLLRKPQKTAKFCLAKIIPTLIPEEPKRLAKISED